MLGLKSVSSNQEWGVRGASLVEPGVRGSKSLTLQTGGVQFEGQLSLVRGSKRASLRTCEGAIRRAVLFELVGGSKSASLRTCKHVVQRAILFEPVRGPKSASLRTHGRF